MITEMTGPARHFRFHIYRITTQRLLNNIMEILALLACGIVGYAIGNIQAWYNIRKIIIKTARENNIDLSNLSDIDDYDDNGDKIITKTEIKVMRTEQIGDILYLYDCDDAFVCQGPSLADLAKQVHDYKHIPIVGVVHGTDTVLFMKGKVVEVIKP